MEAGTHSLRLGRSISFRLLTSCLHHPTHSSKWCQRLKRSDMQCFLDESYWQRRNFLFL